MGIFDSNMTCFFPIGTKLCTSLEGRTPKRSIQGGELNTDPVTESALLLALF